MGDASSFIEEAVREYWGERCEDFEPECACCRAWAELDGMRAARAEGYRAGIEDAAAEIVDYRNSIENSDELRELEQVIRALPDLPVIYADLSLTAYAPESGSAAIEPQEDR